MSKKKNQFNSFRFIKDILTLFRFNKVIQMLKYKKATKAKTAARKLPPTRSFQPSLAFWFSRIARYAPSPARPNLTEICVPSARDFLGNKA